MYDIYLTEKSRRFLKKLPQKEVEMILNKIHSIRGNPFHFVRRLQGMKLWRLRIQNYRAVLDIVISERKIIVIRIGHRSKVYDR